MPMQDWKVSGYVDPPTPHGEIWVYKTNDAFPNVHLSFSVTNINQSHAATNDRTAYYFGVTKTFNSPRLTAAVRQLLVSAWTDYYT